MSIHRKQDNTHNDSTIEQLGRYNQQKTRPSHQEISKVFRHTKGDISFIEKYIRFMIRNIPNSCRRILYPLEMFTVVKYMK